MTDFKLETELQPLFEDVPGLGDREQALRAILEVALDGLSYSEGMYLAVLILGDLVARERVHTVTIDAELAVWTIARDGVKVTRKPDDGGRHAGQ